MKGIQHLAFSIQGIRLSLAVIPEKLSLRRVKQPQSRRNLWRRGKAGLPFVFFKACQLLNCFESVFKIIQELARQAHSITLPLREGRKHEVFSGRGRFPSCFDPSPRFFLPAGLKILCPPARGGRLERQSFIHDGAIVSFLSLFFLLPTPSFAQTTPTFGEKAVGDVTCSNAGSAADFDTLAQCTSTSAATGTMQKAPLFVGAVTAPPYAATTCDANKAGMIQWTGAAFQACDGTGWRQFVANATPDAFSFTNQTNVATSTTISSNAATLTNFSGTVSATCGSGCTAIARNGAWGGTTVAGFQNGDTIAIRQTSSATASTATNATVTVGTTVSGTWSVTTTADTPAAFSFADQTGVYTSFTVSSDAIALSGFTGSMTAQCNTGCTAIARNGIWGGTTLTGFVSGDTIKIKQTASSTANTSTTTSVTVGSTISSTWTVTTANDPCPGVTTAGTACPDGTIYAGITPDENQKMYTTRCDVGMTWDGSACTGTRTRYPWAAGSIMVDTGYTSLTTGRYNSSGLASLIDSGAPYSAVDYCESLSENGYSDWFLPARNELTGVLCLNRTAIGNFDTAYLYPYWSSSEVSLSYAGMARFSDCNPLYSGTAQGKSGNYNIRCVRRQ